MKKTEKQKIVVTDDMLDKIGKFMGIAKTLEETAKSIRTELETVLNTIAAYNIEIPKKRTKRLIKDSKRSVKWVDKN